MSFDGPQAANDAIRGDGVFERVRRAIFNREAADGTTVILQIVITKQNAPLIEDFLESVMDWPVDGVAFTFYVPGREEEGEHCWTDLDLRERDEVVDRVIDLKRRYPFITSSTETLNLLYSDRCLNATGSHGENCELRNVLPLYVVAGGQLERTFCCYGNNVDCSRCGSYPAFNAARKRQALGPSNDRQGA
ncbi:MAG: hypothetical protein WD002_14095 [Pseudomonadales bacterium]